MTDLSEKETYWEIRVTRRKATRGTIHTTCDSFDELLNYLHRYSDAEEITITKIGTTP